MAAARGSTLYRLALGIATLSGAASLAHQLLWTQRLVDLVGATPTATARVLGCFFLGLSAGAAFSTPLARRTQRPWRTLGRIELAIALLCVPLLTLPQWSARMWPAIGLDELTTWVGSAVKLTLSLVLVTLPALAMGATLPVLARGVLEGSRTLGREGSWLYALETAGGVLGLLATVASALAGAGVRDAMTTAMLVNVALGGLALAIDRRVAAVPANGAAAPTSIAAGAVVLPLAVAFASGLCVLAAEVLAVHLFDQVVSLAMVGAAAVLVSALLPLALASIAGAALSSRLRAVDAAIAFALALASLAALAVPFLFVWQTGGVRYLALETDPGVARFLTRAVGLGLGSFGLFLFAAGLVLPLTFRWFEQAANDPHGRRWGWLLAANGAGGLAGAELASHVLMPAFGMHVAFAVLAALYAALALGLSARTGRGTARVARTAALAVVLSVAAVLALAPLRALPLVRPDLWPQAKRGMRLVELATGAEGTAAVVDFGDDRVILVNNQYVLGGTRSALRQERMALLPSVLHPAPRRVAFIGLGTGITSAAAFRDPAVERVTAIEVSPLVAALSRRHFGAATARFATNPRARVVLEDGRIAIGAETNAYDLIVGDLVLPWEVGAGRLYSVEHFLAVRRALAPGGEFCLWLPMFQLTPEEFGVIVASFREAFPRIELFRDDLSEEAPAFALVGFRDGALDWDAASRRALALQASGRTRDGFVAFPKLLRSLHLGTLDPSHPGDARRNTLDNAWVEHQSAREQAGVPGHFLDEGSWSLLPQYLRDFSGP